MSVTPTKENGTVKHPLDAAFPEGAKVRVELIEGPSKQQLVEAWLERAVGVGVPGVTTDQVLSMTRGER